jgi:23S rRNA pseudouridine2605 synthase
MAELVRISKALADAGVASRRAADDLVSAGRVTVNGEPALIGRRIDPARDRLAVDGRLIARPGRRTYLVLNKPAGVTSTVRDRHAGRTVLDLVPPHLARGSRLYPVGRLDRDSEGLLLLTDDGDWTQRLLHPRHGVEREYAVGMAEPLADEQMRALDEGVRLPEGVARLVMLRPATRAESAAHARTHRGGDRPLVWYRAVLTSGWKRQIRRMFATVGSHVERLVRVRIGTLWLGDLAPGAVRPLTRAEREGLAAIVAEG